MKSMRDGFLIAIEGADGSGKSSLAHLLYKKLSTIYSSVILTKEPGGTPLGEQIRAIVNGTESILCTKAEFLLFAANRAEHFEKLIIPALKNNALVISDRLADSSLVFQGYAKGLDIKTIQSINQWAMNNYTPNITLYVKVDVQTAMTRIKNRNLPLSTFEQKKDFIAKTIDGFNDLYKDRTDVITLDGLLDLNTLETLAEQHILKRLHS